MTTLLLPILGVLLFAAAVWMASANTRDDRFYDENLSEWEAEMERRKAQRERAESRLKKAA